MAPRIPGAVSAYPVRVVITAVLLLVGTGLLAVGLLGWRGRLPRNRFAGVCTPAALRSDAAFVAANRVAGLPVIVAGAVCAGSGALALGASGATLAVIVGIGVVGTVLLVVAGGVLGDRAAATVRPVPIPCGRRACGAGGCAAG